MRHLRAAVSAAAVILLSLVTLPRTASAQGEVFVDLPSDVPFPAAPQIFVRAVGFADTSQPLRIRLRLALDNSIGLVVYDSTQAGNEPVFSTLRLLPENRDIYAEATVFDNQGRTLRTVIQLAGRTGPRLQLVAPSATSGVVFLDRRPTFQWRSAKVSSPPGPWVYELFVTEVSSQVTRSVPNILDTVFKLPFDLDANTSYRWRVVARLANGVPGDEAERTAPSSFTIQPSDAVVKTLLYQNFPNPFPAPSSGTTCVWFDLKTAGRVELTVLDIRGHRVRTLVPGELPAQLPAGRYGRASEFDPGGCDPRLKWDGRSDDGRMVTPGLYLLRFKAEGEPATVKRMLFLGY